MAYRQNGFGYEAPNPNTYAQPEAWAAAQAASAALGAAANPRNYTQAGYPTQPAQAYPSAGNSNWSQAPHTTVNGSGNQGQYRSNGNADWTGNQVNDEPQRSGRSDGQGRGQRQGGRGRNSGGNPNGNANMADGQGRGQRGEGRGRGSRERSPINRRSQDSPEFGAPAPARGRGRAGTSGVNPQQGVRHMATAATQQPQAPMQVDAGPSHARPAPTHVQAKGPTVDSRHLSSLKFADLSISPLTKRAMAEVFGYEACTLVQAESLPPALQGQDLLAKAKTGTGKTLGFMIPIIEQILRGAASPGKISALVLSPTRELANQIYEETRKLLTFHNLTCQVVVGGTNVNTDLSSFKRRVPDILIATPGRCVDLMTTQAPWVAQLFSGVRYLVFDEADNLLDMGFRPAIDQILKAVPPPATRQTLMFSATFPRDVAQLLAVACKRQYASVDTVGEDTGTNVQVEQYSVVLPLEQQLAYLYAVLEKHISSTPDHKVLVFFTTAKQTALASELFNAMRMPVLEMHSRKSQAQRTRTADEFRAGSGLIMFSSDVSARGVDYPDVTLVVQVGLPQNKEQYVHRLGRTARAGKAGQGVLVLADFEAPFLRSLKDLPIQALPDPGADTLKTALERIARGLQQVDYDSKSKSYAAWLGYYKACSLRLEPATAVRHANAYAATLGLPEPPALEARLIGKMGLKGVPGLRIAPKAAGGPGGPAPGRGRR